VLEISLSTGKLFAYIPPQRKYELGFCEGLVFCLRGVPGYDIEFVTNEYGKIKVPLRQKCVITTGKCASQKIADNKGKNVIENGERLKSASESMVENPGRRRQDTQDRSCRSRVTDREIRAEQTV
jgi:hypothetical protein